MGEELQPLERLEELFRSPIEADGHRLVQFLIAPSRREVVVLIELSEDLLLDAAEKQTKDEFLDIARNMRVEERGQQVEKAAEGMASLLEDFDEDGGFL